jgi:hypothetical protein
MASRRGDVVRARGFDLYQSAAALSGDIVSDKPRRADGTRSMPGWAIEVRDRWYEVSSADVK